MTLARTQTVSDWTAGGYRGLRIMRCQDCRHATHRTWAELGAAPEEDVIAVARRMRCRGCGQPPAGLGVVAFREVDEVRRGRSGTEAPSPAGRAKAAAGIRVDRRADTVAPGEPEAGARRSRQR